MGGTHNRYAYMGGTHNSNVYMGGTHNSYVYMGGTYMGRHTILMFTGEEHTIVHK